MKTVVNTILAPLYFLNNIVSGMLTSLWLFGTITFVGMMQIFSPKSTKPIGNCGFTLVELMFLITIAAIIIGLIVCVSWVVVTLLNR